MALGTELRLTGWIESGLAERKEEGIPNGENVISVQKEVGMGAVKTLPKLDRRQDRS